MRVGTDIIEIDRIRDAATPAFLRRVFAPRELAYYEQTGRRIETLAGMFCAKEAVAKALGSGFVGFAPIDVCIGHDESGAPVVTLCGAAQSLFPHAQLQVSISHCKAYAVATAIKN